MSNIRKPLNPALLDELYSSQDNHCAMCLSRDQLDAHHIIPVKDGGMNIFDNLILLCKACHTTADSEAIPPSILKYYKYTCKTDPIIYPRDKIGIYQHFSTSIIKELTHTYNEDLINTAKNVIRHLMRSRDSHYRIICLNLINSILFSNMHSERLTSYESNALVNLAEKLMTDKKNEYNELFLNKQIYHNIGIIYHINNKHINAIEMYSKALNIHPEIINDNHTDIIKSEDFMTKVHMTSTLYMLNKEKESFYKIEQILSSQNLFNDKTQYDPHSFAMIRLAEHYISQKDIIKAEDELRKLLSSKLIGFINPIHQVIMYKDLARVYILNGETEKGKYYLVAALTLAKKFKYYNQIAKIKGLKEINEVNVDINELYNMLGE